MALAPNTVRGRLGRDGRERHRCVGHLSALSQIFRVAVYQYALTGAAPAGFERRLLQEAFDGRPNASRVDSVTGRPP